MLGEFISAHKEEILKRCLGEHRKQNPDRSDDELIDSLPQFVDDLIATLGRDNTIPAEQRDSQPDTLMAKRHGALRKSQGFDVTALVHDFGLICDAVNIVAQKHHETSGPAENQILNLWVDNAIALALESFLKEERADEQRKRAMDLGFLAHEIRNAASNATLGFDLIRRGKAPANGRVAAVVERSLLRITTLVLETIESAHATNMVAGSRTHIRLSEHTHEFLAAAGIERGVSVHFDIPDDLSVEANPTLLTSAVSNLLQNAVKFTRDNDSVWLRASAENGLVTIEVEDRCGGLPEGRTDYLFRPFVQSEKDPRGAGLGLAIARRAVEAHGGRLNVRNLPGVGCVFTMHLPDKPKSITMNPSLS